MYRFFNPNPTGARVGDCAVRAVSAALGESWEESFIGLSLTGYLMGDLPSSNLVWGAYLRKHGFRKRLCEDSDCNVEEFAKAHPKGLYVLALSGHVVTLIDGDWLDSWNSFAEVPIYYWTKE